MNKFQMHNLPIWLVLIPLASLLCLQSCDWSRMPQGHRTWAGITADLALSASSVGNVEGSSADVAIPLPRVWVIHKIGHWDGLRGRICPPSHGERFQLPGPFWLPGMVLLLGLLAPGGNDLERRKSVKYQVVLAYGRHSSLMQNEQSAADQNKESQRWAELQIGPDVPF